MSTLREHLHIFLVRLINLTGLQNLQANSTILIISQERTTTRLTDILHHATDAHWAIQLLTQVCSIHLLALRIDAEVLLNKLCNLSKLSIVNSCIQQTQIFESLLLQFYQYTSNNLLPDNCFRLQTVRHDIINILHKDNICFNLIKVLYQGTMTTGTEQQRTI